MLSLLNARKNLASSASGCMVCRVMTKPLCILACAGLAVLPLGAADFNPVNVTGFNFDAVVESNSGNFSATAQSLDATGNVFYESGLPGSAGGSGLPASETVSASTGNNTFTFNLASYGNNAGLVSNSLIIAPGPGGHAFIPLTLTTSASFQSMAFLGFSTEAQPASAIGDIQLTFSDNSTSIYSGALDIPDWYVGNGTVSTPLIYNSTGRVNINNNQFNQDLSGVTAADGGKLFASVITLTGIDQTKLVQSVGFRITSSTSADRTYIMSASAVPAVPEPATLALLAVAAVAWATLRRRTTRTA